MTDIRPNLEGDAGPPPADELDALLRQWHRTNADRAAAGRARLLAAVAVDSEAASADPEPPAPIRFADRMRSVVMNPITRAAAVIVLFLGVAALLVPHADRAALACDVVQLPDGGRLEALDEKGALLGPCPLKHTDVKVDIAGHFSRVTLRQTYSNPYAQKIEAVYTFPMSHRSAVDRMRMIVGERVVEGEVKEREMARRIYEAARESGYVASLLEQERPNIFTQSVANIEPNATVEVEISYIETLEQQDGRYSFAFPMVVGPRYIPGSSWTPPPGLPECFEGRRGVALLGPATVTIEDTASAAPTAGGGAPIAAAPTGDELADELFRAVPVSPPAPAWWQKATDGAVTRTCSFKAAYADGAVEKGELYSDGSGQVNGRWFWLPNRLPAAGGGFSPDTNQVPDASRITPMPVRPPTRAGHDVSLSVSIDTGGPAIKDLRSELHKIVERDGDGPGRTEIVLANQAEIPNRDFVLSWSAAGEGVAEGVFAHAEAQKGGFVSLVLNPPARVEPSMVRPRELVFVLDTSGSMRGFPLEKAKEVMAKAIAGMRPSDTFNMITFAGSTRVLWSEPRPATPENQAAAQAFLAGQGGGGGTEMMKAIEAALVQTAPGGGDLDAAGLADLPADGRQVSVVVPFVAIEQDNASPFGWRLRVNERVAVPVRLGLDLPTILQPQGVELRLRGTWSTEKGERVLAVNEAGFAGADAGAPMRICMFLTDGYVGNDQAIIAAVGENARTTRVFSFGIGNSVNRYLLENMALAGRGACEFVLLSDGADAAVERFARRIENPVLTDIQVAFSDNLGVTDVVPGQPAGAGGLIPDLYDVKPLVIHGRYAKGGTGTITITGRTGNGRYERTIPITLPAVAPDHAQLPALWARAEVDTILAPHLAAVQEGSLDLAVRQKVVALGETYQIMTPYTSFVAVEKARVTLGGKPMLVAVPIELPQGTSWDGFFGPAGRRPRPMLTQYLSMVGSEPAPEAMGDDVNGGNDGSVYRYALTLEKAPEGSARESDNLSGFDEAQLRFPMQLADAPARREAGQAVAGSEIRTATAATGSEALGAQLGQSGSFGVQSSGGAAGGTPVRDASRGLAWHSVSQPIVQTESLARKVSDPMQFKGGFVGSVVPAGEPTAGGVALGGGGGGFGGGGSGGPAGALPAPSARPAAPPPPTPAAAAATLPAETRSAPAPGDGRGLERSRANLESAESKREGAKERLDASDDRKDLATADKQDAGLGGTAGEVAAKPQSAVGGDADQGVLDRLEEARTTTIYDVRDLATMAGGDNPTARVAEVVVSFVPPPADGSSPMGTISVSDGQLVVQQSDAAKGAFAATLSELRLAVGGALGGDQAIPDGATPLWPKAPADASASVIVLHPIDELVMALMASPEQAGTGRDQVERALQKQVNEVLAADPGSTHAGRSSAAVFGGFMLVNGSIAAQERAFVLLASLRDELGLPIVVDPHPDPLPSEVVELIRAREAREAQQARLELLWRVLSPELFSAIVAVEDPKGLFVDRERLAAEAGDRAVQPTDRAVPVTVLVDGATPKALKAAGLDVQAAAPESKVVVGTIEPARFADLALVEGVRRVSRREP